MDKDKRERFDQLKAKTGRKGHETYGPMSKEDQDEFLLLYKELGSEYQASGMVAVRVDFTVPRSKHWLDGVRSVFQVDQTHPRVARIFELMQKAESGATITDDEAKQFQWETDLLGDEVIPIWEAAHPDERIQKRGKPVSNRTEAYLQHLASPSLPDPLIPHETADGVECKRCGLKKEFWERIPYCGGKKPPPYTPKQIEFSKRIMEKFKQLEAENASLEVLKKAQEDAYQAWRELLKEKPEEK